MRAVIIGNGDIKDYKYIKSKISADDFVICADGGLRHIENLDIKADVAIGDFDSADIDEEITHYVFPVDKDYTDGELAVNYAVENGYDDILLIAMTGQRLDHTLTNIFLLARHKNMCLIDDKNEIYVVKDRLEIENKVNKTLSVIPVFSDLEINYIRGVKYPLEKETLYFGTGRGNSNVVVSSKCVISISKGIGVVIITDGE